MNSKIEKIFQVTIPRDSDVTKDFNIAVYRKPKGGKWNYCIIKGRNSETLPMEFDGSEAIWLAGGNKKWHPNWDYAMDRLNDFHWQIGVDAWCHPDYGARIWKYYIFWQELTHGIWLSVNRQGPDLGQLELERKRIASA